MPREFRLPDVGEGIAEGELLQWLVDPGDAVTEDQPVAEVETDKAVVEVPAPLDGTVQELHAEPGDIVPVGDVLVTFATDETADAARTGTEEPETDDGPSREQVFAPPSVRRLARELDVDVDSVEGSGPGGRLTTRDVRAATDRDDADTESGSDDDTTGRDVESDGEPAEMGVESVTATPAEDAADRERTLATPATRKLADDLGVDLDAVPASERRDGEAFVTSDAVREYAETQQDAQAADAADLAAGDRVEREPYRGVRRTIGEAMANSKFTAPHATHHDRVDATGLVEVREKLRPLAEERGVRLTYLPIVMKTVVGALKDHPVLNTMLDEENEEIVYNYDYNVGVAVATDAGLMVPVVEAVDEKTLLEIAAEVSDLVERARDRSIDLEEMQGGTFTVTNFGTIGGEYATPIVNHPETAILGLGALAQRPMVEDGSLSDPGEVVARPVLPLSLSIDHRVIDGADAARFVNTLKEYLRDPTLLLLD